MDGIDCALLDIKPKALSVSVTKLFSGPNPERCTPICQKALELFAPLWLELNVDSLETTLQIKPATDTKIRSLEILFYTRVDAQGQRSLRSCVKNINGPCGGVFTAPAKAGA